MLRFSRRVGLLLLLTSGTTSCITEEGQCHRRAMAMLGCCPSCDANCEVSNNADAKFALESCLADLGQQRDQEDARHDQTSASEEDVGTTPVGGSGETTFGGAW